MEIPHTNSIIHVDMDAFYASVEQRENPTLEGQPVIVGGRPESRGVVAACSYAAREYGIHSAMATKTALQLCPQAMVIQPRIGFYSEISKQLREIFFRYTPLVEPLSLDEAFLDVSGSAALFGSAEGIGRRIKQEIFTELGLIASVGVAPNKYLAKLASDHDKPDGFTVIESSGVHAFLEPLPVNRIWGVGKATEKKLADLGIHTIRQLKARSVEDLESRFGSPGRQMWSLAQGIDPRPVIPDRAAKSISNETTFATDIQDREALRATLLDLTVQVAQRLRRVDLLAKTVHLKVRYHDFQTLTRSETLHQPSDSTDLFFETVVELLEQRLPDRFLSLRLIGMGVSGFSGSGQSERQQGLFDRNEQQQREKIDVVSDLIHDRFGGAALRRGVSSGSASESTAKEKDASADANNMEWKEDRESEIRDG